MAAMPSVFGSRVAAAVAGASPRQVQYWDTTGLVSSAVPTTGPGTPRGWSFVNLIQLRTVAHLRSLGVSLHSCRKVADYLAKEGDSFSSRKLIVRDGDSPDVMTVGDRDLALSLLEQPGQIVTRLCVVDLDARLAEVRARLRDALKEESKRVKPLGRPRTGTTTTTAKRGS